MLLVTLCVASTILRTPGASGSAGQISAVVYDMAAGGTASGRRSDNSKRMLRAPAAGGSAGPSNVVCAALWLVALRAKPVQSCALLVTGGQSCTRC